jgi:hypothetical protein
VTVSSATRAVGVDEEVCAEAERDTTNTNTP